MKIRNEFVQNLFKKWRNEAGRSYCFDCLRRSKWWQILAPKRLSMLHPHGRDKAQHIKFEEKILKLRLDSKSSFQVQLLSLRQLQADFSISTKALFPVSMLWYGTLTWPVQQQSYETPELVQCWCIVSSKSKKIRQRKQFRATRHVVLRSKLDPKRSIRRKRTEVILNR